MFCNNCGNQLEEGTFYCPYCGKNQKAVNISQQDYAPQQAYGPQQNYGNSPKKDNKKKRNFIIGLSTVAIVAIAVILAAVLLIKHFVGRSYEKTIKIYVEASMSGDVEKIIDLMPDEMVDKACEEEGFLNEKEMVKEMEDELEEQLEYLDDYYGKGWKYSYEIVDEEDYSTSELREMRSDFKEDYDIRLDIEEAKEVKVEIEISSKDGELSNTSTMWIDLIKIGNTWYIGGM